jgi:hypothetical protein
MSTWTRRRFIESSSVVTLFGGPVAVGVHAQQAPSSEGAAGTAPAAWPQQDPVVVRDMVGICHADVKRVREFLERQPALANAAIDWAFGDWEDALGAASHVGRREIAELLLSYGARPSMFSAAMLGQLDVIKALVTARPGIQRTYGPHGITLMAHARAGGADAAAVVKYLESVGDADRRLTTTTVAAADRDAIVGRYGFGSGPRDYVEVDVQNDQLGIQRPDTTRRFLLHTVDVTFFPSGVPSVKITFGREGGRVVRINIADPAGLVTGRRVGA